MEQLRDLKASTGFRAGPRGQQGVSTQDAHKDWGDFCNRAF